MEAGKAARPAQLRTALLVLLGAVAFVLVIVSADAANLLLARAVGRALSTLVFGVSVWDGSTYAGVSGLLAVVALASCPVPAIRASCVDPMGALRLE